MNVLFKILFVATFIIKTSQTASESLKKETSQSPTPSKDKEMNNDRFLQDLDDAEWHVAHLRHAEFEGRRDCMGENFADKARRYRKTLRRDGALVMFVSAEPIAYNESDIFEDSCKVELEDEQPLKTSPEIKISPLTTSDHISVEKTNPGFADSLIVTPALVNANQSDSTFANLSSMTAPMSPSDTSPTVDFKATTPAMKPKEDSSEESKKSQDPNKKARRSEYMFSSVEYYDEVPDFDVSQCPDVVDAIELQIDQLRRYDVECERIIEWRSLHD